MHEKHFRALPWLDRLNLVLPGHGGYQDPEQRRAAELALRNAIVNKLKDARAAIEQAVHALKKRHANSGAPTETEIASLRRAESHLDALIARGQRHADHEEFYRAGPLDSQKAEALHAFDLELYELAEDVLQRLTLPDTSHDLLANVELDLQRFEVKLELRALILSALEARAANS